MSSGYAVFTQMVVNGRSISGHLVGLAGLDRPYRDSWTTVSGGFPFLVGLLAIR